MAKAFVASLLLLSILQGGNAQGQCSLSNITVRQTRTGRTVEGAPEVEVAVSNDCSCAQANVVVKSVGFSSFEPVDPNLFKPLGNDLFSVNNGGAIKQGSPITFRYAFVNPFDLQPVSSEVAC